MCARSHTFLKHQGGPNWVQRRVGETWRTMGLSPCGRRGPKRFGAPGFIGLSPKKKVHAGFWKREKPPRGTPPWALMLSSCSLLPDSVGVAGCCQPASQWRWNHVTIWCLDHTGSTLSPVRGAASSTLLSGSLRRVSLRSCSTPTRQVTGLSDCSPSGMHHSLLAPFAQLPVGESRIPPLQFWGFFFFPVWSFYTTVLAVLWRMKFSPCRMIS